MTALAAATAVAASGGATRTRGWRRYRARTFYAFIAPWLGGFLLLTLVPVIYALVVSFTNYDGASPKWRFIGVRNYVELFTQSPDVWESLLRTIGYVIIVVPLSVAGGLFLAILVNQRIRARGVVRAIFFLPSVVPVVATAIMWRLIFNKDAGLLNGILSVFGVGKVTWLADPYVIYALIVMSLWGLGGGMIISLASLQDVPLELQEAARLDGAGKGRVLWHITLPLISPVLYFQVVTGVIAALQMLIQPLLLAETTGTLSSSMVPQSTTLFMVSVYNEFFYNHRFGFGSAMLWVFFVVILLLTLLMQRGSRRFVFYQNDVEGRKEK
jgi:multiple sugar transport system permease protein